MARVSAVGSSGNQLCWSVDGGRLYLPAGGVLPDALGPLTWISFLSL